jgi:hypothetical protein
MGVSYMKRMALFLLVACFAHAHEWARTEYRDELHNENGVKFFLAAKEKGGGIEVVCSKGKLKAAWLLTDKIADPQVVHFSEGWVSSSSQSLAEVEYRRDDEPKPHKLRLPISKDFHGILLQQPIPSGTHIVLHGDTPRGADRGFENLLYGPMGFGGGDWHRNKKANSWARRLIVGVSSYQDSDAVFTFDVPDPSEVREECGIQ